MFVLLLGVLLSQHRGPSDPATGDLPPPYVPEETTPPIPSPIVTFKDCRLHSVLSPSCRPQERQGAGRGPSGLSDVVPENGKGRGDPRGTERPRKEKERKRHPSVSLGRGHLQTPTTRQKRTTIPQSTVGLWCISTAGLRYQVVYRVSDPTPRLSLPPQTYLVPDSRPVLESFDPILLPSPSEKIGE